MERTSFDRGPMLGYHSVSHSVRFCDSECMKHYRFHRSSSPTQILLHNKHSSTASDRHFLSVFCGLLSTDLERNKVSAQFYCDSSQNDRVYVLLQIRFVPKQRFLAFYLSDNFFPTTCLPNSMQLTDEDNFIIAGLQLVMKAVLAKLNFPDILTCMSSILSDISPTTFPEESLEMPPPQFSLESLPIGFSISEDQAIFCPHLYTVVLHKRKKTYITYLLAKLSGELEKDNQFIVLFYNHSVDCKIKTTYVVEDSHVSITVKSFEVSESQALSSYDKQIVECCKKIVCVEVISMLRENGVDSLEAFITNYK